MSNFKRLIEFVKSDYFRLTNSQLTLRHLFARYILDPGFKSVIIYRVQQSIPERFNRLRLWISSLNCQLTGAQFCVGANIAGGLIVRHPVGIVIGSGVSIGKNCTLLHGVTIGTRYIDEKYDAKYPQIGDNVSIGANSSIIGGIFVGGYAVIGTLIRVTHDVPSETVVTQNF